MNNDFSELIIQLNTKDASPQIEAWVLRMTKKVNFVMRTQNLLLLLKHWQNSTQREAYTKIFFSFLLKSHKHSICPLLYSKTCKISTFIKGPFLFFLCLHLIFSLIGRARGFCCRLEQFYFCSRVHEINIFLVSQMYTSDVRPTTISKKWESTVLLTTTNVFNSEEKL